MTWRQLSTPADRERHAHGGREHSHPRGSRRHGPHLSRSDLYGALCVLGLAAAAAGATWAVWPT